MLLFISEENKEQIKFARFNTSHVTLYLYIRFRKDITADSFNTSHVTLYLVMLRSPHELTKVSIHLMLLFIEIVKLSGLGEDAFQYISCYSLSVRGGNRKTVYRVSIHLMLLFIGAGLIALMSCCVVSIHLMLLFILAQMPNLTCML